MRIDNSLPDFTLVTTLHLKIGSSLDFKIDQSNLSKSSPDLAFLALTALNALARCLLAASCLALETLDLLEDEIALELLRPLDLLEEAASKAGRMREMRRQVTRM